MVESTGLSKEVKKTFAQIVKDAGDLAKVEEVTLESVHKDFLKMPGRSDRHTLNATLDTLFGAAAEQMKDEHDKSVLEGLRKLVHRMETDLYDPKPRYIDAFFFPNKANITKLVNYIKKAQKSLLICVFNLTNDDLANAVLDRHRNGVAVRIITDDECCKNKGNDIQYLADGGIPTRTDDAPDYHMHNKFMVVDNSFLLTGSFNWTFQAGANNQENLLVVDNPFYIEKYSEEFEKLWKQFENSKVEAHLKASVAQKKQTASQPVNQGASAKAEGHEFKGW